MYARVIKVWDPFVRIFHWSLVIAFFVAYFTEPEDSGLALHVWAGYFVGGLIVLRVVWGFMGTQHARFSDFAFGPFRALSYFGDLARGRSKRHLGHSPAGAWMVYLLLLTLAATVLSGMIVLATEKHQGPLAPFFASTATTIAIERGGEGAARAEATRGGESEGRGEDAIEERTRFLRTLY